MGERREKWEREKRIKDFKKRRKAMVQESRNQIKISSMSWADLRNKAKGNNNGRNRNQDR